jgi:hypothetical protein
MENISFDQKADNLVREFFEFTQSADFKQPKKSIFNVNYDIRESLEGVEVDMRDRLRILQVEMNRSPTLKIFVQDIINFVLFKFFASEHDINLVMEEYFATRHVRKKVKNQPTTSNLTAENRNLVNELCSQIKSHLFKQKLNPNDICLRYFVDFLLTKFIKEYYI